MNGENDNLAFPTFIAACIDHFGADWWDAPTALRETLVTAITLLSGYSLAAGADGNPKAVLAKIIKVREAS